MIRSLQWLWVGSLVLALAACGNTEQEGPAHNRLEGSIFGSFYTITLVGDYESEELERLREGLVEQMNRVDMAMSTYKDDSELMAFNNAEPGEWVELSDDLYQVLDISQSVAAASDGAFDVTVGGLVNLWTFGPEARPERRPTEELLQERLSLAGYQNLELDPEQRRARRTTDSFVDLSGVAKGYAVDLLGEWLLNQGIEHFMVNLGGDMIVSGERAPGQKWRVGIELPDSLVQQAKYVLPLSNTSVATSGDYRNYFEADGRRYSHTIDPATGEPVNHDLASVTVVHESNAIADAWATAMMVVGTQGAQALAEDYNLKVLLLSREQDQWVTWQSAEFEAEFGELEAP